MTATRIFSTAMRESATRDVRLTTRVFQRAAITNLGAGAKGFPPPTGRFFPELVICSASTQTPEGEASAEICTASLSPRMGERTHGPRASERSCIRLLTSAATLNVYLPRLP